MTNTREMGKNLAGKSATKTAHSGQNPNILLRKTSFRGAAFVAPCVATIFAVGPITISLFIFESDLDNLSLEEFDGCYKGYVTELANRWLSNLPQSEKN